MTQKDSLLTFPCEFPIKVIGVNKDSYITDIITLTKKHFPTVTEAAFRSDVSQKNNYLSLTITLMVQDQTTLDALYQDLTAHPDTRMVL